MKARLSTLLAALALTAGAAWAGEPAFRIEVLRAESYSAVLDVLLRIEPPASFADELLPDDFAVYIAPAALPAAEATGAPFRVRRVFLKRIGASYFLDLRQLPPGAGTAACQLIVHIARGERLLASHRVAQFLEAAAEQLDVALIIDESYSMRETDPRRLRVEAAKTFVDLARRGPRIGRITIVAFNDEPRTLAPLTSPADSDALYHAIDQVRATGQTDMDGALDRALALLGKSATPPKAVLLLTDGKDEPRRYQEAHRAFADRRWRVYTVGLSDRADAETLQRIAGDTGGEYHHAPTSAELQDIFGKICFALQKKVVIRSRALKLEPGEPAEDPLDVDDTISVLTLSLGAREPDIAFALRDAAGGELTPQRCAPERGITYGRKASYQHYDLRKPTPGRWAAYVTSPKPAEAALAATAVTPLLLRGFPLKPTHYRGEPVEIAVSLANGDALLPGARVEARVTAPDGATSAVPLYDDGRHLDTASGDGVFAGFFPGSEQPGGCAIHVVATGTTPAGHAFERELRLATAVSTEGYSKLWCSARRLDFGVLYNGETAAQSLGIKLMSSLSSPAAEVARVVLDAPVTPAGQRVPSEAIRVEPTALELERGRVVALKMALAVPSGQAPGRYSGRLELTSKYDTLAIPVDVEVRAPAVAVDKRRLDLGALESGSRAEAAFRVRLDPRGALPARLSVSDPRLTIAPAALELGDKPGAVRVAFRPAPDHASDEIEAKVLVETPVAKVELPVTARVVRPSFALAPAAVDFGELAPGETGERQVTVSLDALQPREAIVAVGALAGPEGVPPLALVAPAGAKLAPGEPAAVPLKLKVPPAQPPGAYRGEVLVRTPLGERKIACAARVGTANTFRVRPVLDFERVAVGTTRELEVEVESLVDAEQRVELALPSLPPERGDWHLAAEPAALTLPPRGKASVTLRLTASAAAAPGPRSAAVDFRGPSRDASMEARAVLFRPPHQSIAFEPCELDVGRLQAGIAERLIVQVRSLVDESQAVTVEGVDAPARVVGVRAQPAAWTLGALEARAVELSLEPVVGADEAPFEAVVTARGRSLPATLRVRGSVFTPPGRTFALADRLLDFGPMAPGQEAELALIARSLWHREQRISLAAPPAADGVALSAERGGAVLLPGVMHPIGVQVAVASDATPGERRVRWEVRGPGDSETFEVRVEVLSPPPPPGVATTEPGGIGWLEGVLLFLLLFLLLAILVATYLLARWLIRSQRVPRMAKYFAVSGLLHVAALFITLDIFLARKVQKQELGPLFRVGLRAVSAGAFSSQQASAADELRSQAERERRLEALRRQEAAARAARELLEAERRKLDPTRAELAKPEMEEKPDFTPTPPDTQKLTVEDVAKVMEDLREAARLSQTPKPDSQDASQVEAARLAELRAMSREQLESVVRAAVEPKATSPAAPQKTSASPQVPALADASGAQKTRLSPDELIPAIEGLRQELGQQEAAAAAAGTPAPQAVGAQRSEAGSPAERTTGASGEPAIPEARTAGSGARPAAGRATPVAPLEGPGLPAATSKLAPPAFAMPEEVLPAAEAMGPAAGPDAAQGSGLAARSVGVARPQGQASIERSTTVGGRVALADPHAVEAPGRASSGSAPSEMLAREVEGPVTERSAAPIAFATPAESPGADALVRVPATQGARREAEPLVIPIARLAGSGRMGARGHAVAEAARASVAAPRATAPGESAGRAQATVAIALPAAAVVPGRAKLAPSLDQLELAEGPLVAPRQEATRGGPGLAPASASAVWRPPVRGEGEGHIALAGVGAGSQLVPRVGAVSRTASGAPAAGVPPEAAGGQRSEAPQLAGVPQENVGAALLVSAPARGAGEAPAAVGVQRAGAHAHDDRGRPAAAAGRSELLARPTGLARPGPSPRVAGRLPTARTAAGGRTEVAPAGGPSAESVEPGTRFAERGGAPGPSERSVAAARVPVGGAPAEPARAPTASRPESIEPRSATTRLARSTATDRLLLPELAMRGEEAGAFVGDASGTVRGFMLTTIKYGSGEVDWDTHKTTMPFLAWQLRERVGFNIETEIREMPLDSDGIMRSPWLYMSGHKDFRFTDEQVLSLRRYLLAGGTLWADDSTHEDDYTWDKAFRREIARVLPPAEGHTLGKITKDDKHPLFRSCFDLSEGYKGYWPPPGDKYRQNFIEGIELKGRLAVIYTRNDYGDGLEIKPDTFPIKASLSGLSPEEMQESSFLMASNIVIYILTGGRGMADRGVVGRAAMSLRKHHEGRRAQRDPYENAPATLFDSFAAEQWQVERGWDKAGAATLRYARHADPDAEGRRLSASFRIGRGEAKVVLVRDLPEEPDFSQQDRCYVDIESRLDGGARLALALITMPDWKYFESRPAFIKPGRQRVFFDLHAPTWKTGQRVAEGENEYSTRPANLEAVRRFVILLYPVQPEGTVVLDRIEFRSKP